MTFLVSRSGQPLRKRRYIFSECFTIIAQAACARATGNPALLAQATELYAQVLTWLRTAGLLPPKWDTETRPMKGLAVPMLLIATAQELCRNGADTSLCTRWTDDAICEIQRDFMHPELECVLEVVGPQGEFLDHLDGRTLNPGHSIECAWFILDEALTRDNDPALMQTGLTILDWMWARGWDQEYGGIT